MPYCTHQKERSTTPVYWKGSIDKCCEKSPLVIFLFQEMKRKIPNVCVKVSIVCCEGVVFEYSRRLVLTLGVFQECVDDYVYDGVTGLVFISSVSG